MYLWKIWHKIPLVESATAEWGNRDELYPFLTKQMKECFVWAVLKEAIDASLEN